MDTKKNIEERLWDFIDGITSQTEKDEIESLLRSSDEWQKAYKDILRIANLLQATEIEQPPLRFSKNVMDEIAKYKIAPATTSYVNKKIVYGIAGFFLLIITGFLVYLFTQIDYSTGETYSIPVDFSKLNFDWKEYINPTVLNLFLMADAVIGLMLLDRYLNKKKKEHKTI